MKLNQKNISKDPNFSNFHDLISIMSTIETKK